MEYNNGSEISQLVEGIKIKAEDLLSRVPVEERQEGHTSLAIQPVVPDPDNLIATADVITVDRDKVGSVISQTTSPESEKVFNKAVFLNNPGGPSIIEWEADLGSEGNYPDIEVEDIFDAIQNLRPATVSELNQLDELLSRSQKGFRVIQPGTYRKTT